VVLEALPHAPFDRKVFCCDLDYAIVVGVLFDGENGQLAIHMVENHELVVFL
jgi:hypothetical protein